MLREKIDEMISSAMKEHKTKELEVYRLIKAELTKAEKDGTKMDEVSETKILLKMASQRNDSIAEYIKGGRNDLAENEKAELCIINNFIPKQPTEEEIEEYTRATITAYKVSKEDSYKLSMKDMKPILTIVQEKYPSANGKVVSKTLQSVINNK
jgi:uncharacterized protein YqeY